ncbi:hypothetical protein [Arthrobacter sp. MMS18-M83]|uniref:hypothetical protein n=1 Tax=Arthrobacter sp. MMS18-M83 TaxID=2996261 RepID=UPI00227C4E5E|nr:hypothetical protein [Arthrobacter sp. MMS18-M83]WAH97257.1 hypothetical protein OW521_23435 [Arthrobacter sp. MMS18-M83]
MEYRHLGRTGVRLSPLCLRAMKFDPWINSDTANSIRIIHRALDAGINGARELTPLARRR